jgi:hypothetical protein
MTRPNDVSNDIQLLVRLLADVERRQIAGEREAAQREAVNACRALIDALQGALGEEPLRGLPNLGRGSRPRYLRRVRAPGRLHLLDEREELCINARGKLVMANSTDERRVCDEELTVNDAALLARALTQALEQHLAATEQTSATYNEMRDLSQRIVKLVKGE